MSVPKDVPLVWSRLLGVLDYEPSTGVFRWKVRGKGIALGSIAGRTKKSGYSQIKIDQVAYGSHRLAWMYIHGVWPSQIVDHINFDTTDNRISNLRLATSVESGSHRRSSKPKLYSALKGVSKIKRGKYVAGIRVRYKQIHLGVFDTADEAHQAYCAAATNLHGAFKSFH